MVVKFAYYVFIFLVYPMLMFTWAIHEGASVYQAFFLFVFSVIVVGFSEMMILWVRLNASR